jgi:hypothetical protein
MGDFVLLQMDDFFTDDVCFDISTKEEWRIGALAVPHSVKISADWHGGIGQGQSEGPELR